MEGAEVFGSQCIVLSIQAMKRSNGKYEAYTDNGREPTGKDVFEWAQQAVELGAGEILVTSIDREGTGTGFDIELIGKIVQMVDVPVIACGGAGSPKHVTDLISACNVDAVSAASIFHYYVITKFGVEKREEGNVDYLKKFVSSHGSILRNLNPTSVSELKAHLRDSNIPCTTTQYSANFESEQLSIKNEVQIGTGISRPLVALIDYGRSNLFSVQHALETINARVEITNDPDMILKVDKLIIAGVGAFADGIEGLRRNGLIDPIKEFVAQGKPVLGICLGMQLFMTEGEEFGLHAGLNLISGRVVKLKALDAENKRLKIPHIGWNEILLPNDDLEGTRWSNTSLLKGISPGEYVYFLHSYIVVPDDLDTISAQTTYGVNSFCSVIVKDNVYGCQFHPERSSIVGLRIYRNFVMTS